ncbi:TIGR01777 family oxidoreductase [Kiritimatiellota bacterium B12222]|nr:TIGR01777 family oxidoreductase [Kiritimatiellota bacterium B12222]
MESQNNKNILITGASGLLGTAITPQLTEAWTALRHGDAGWDPENGNIDPACLQGKTAIIHLAGEPIAAGRWTRKQKQKIYDSRVKGTRAIATAIAQMEKKPECLICASAIGIYGSRGEELLTETSSAGEGYLPELVKEWEAATEPARAAGVRVVHLRLGVVLSTEGGALAKMLPIFKLGLGGRLGSGRMWMSGVHINDAANAFVQALRSKNMSGPYNLTAPSPFRNSEFTQRLSSELRKPAFLPVPAFAIKIALGEMGENLLLTSSRVLPKKLQASGFTFHYPDVAHALKNLLNQDSL